MLPKLSLSSTGYGTSRLYSEHLGRRAPETPSGSAAPGTPGPEREAKKTRRVRCGSCGGLSSKETLQPCESWDTSQSMVLWKFLNPATSAILDPEPYTDPKKPPLSRVFQYGFLTYKS